MKIILNPGEYVIVELPNGECCIVEAYWNLPWYELERLNSEDGYYVEPAADKAYLSVRLNALKGRVPFMETVQFLNTEYLVAKMRSIANLEED